MNICRILVRQCHTDITWFLQSAGEDLNLCKENSISKVVLPSLSGSPVGYSVPSDRAEGPERDCLNDTS